MLKGTGKGTHIEKYRKHIILNGPVIILIARNLKKYNFEQISLKCKVSMVYLITLSTLYVYCIYENVYYIYCSGITDNTMLWYNKFSLISRLSGCVNT